MKKFILVTAVIALFTSCKETANDSQELIATTIVDSATQQIIPVAEFEGQQITGVTVSDSGRIFVNFPRWRKGVANSVVEITADQNKESYPNEEWNSWEIGQAASDDKFLGVQSVVAFENKLYILDTRSALFQKVMDAPRLYVFDLTTDELMRTYVLQKESYHPDSYINDLRVDTKNNKIYLTDSGHAGLILLDIDSGKSRRILNEHKSTTAEQSYLTFGDEKWENTINSDGIALDTKNNRLYYHALTAYSLYSIGTEYLQMEDVQQIEEQVKFEATTAAPDGMIFDQAGNLYFADLENNKIQYRKPDGSIHTLVEGDAIRWADTFSIYDNYLYFTNSRINEVSGDISNMTFSLNKIKLASY
jgi:sugar lactone lactonase YvrE